ncbi:MAG TPA: class I SAM-dependent methyltransferase [Roseiflexaceae bacterium]|nr:class I SAM-dependent methyltransferase [Roseiflexaceae bacterium]
MPERVRDVWAAGEPYEQYVGRWSRAVAREFLTWLDMPSGQLWADVGCGTGALAAGILATAGPQAIFAADRSAGFLAFARDAIPDPRAFFAVADACALPWTSGQCDITVSGLMLNFVPDAAAALREMARVTRPGGRIALYVWDYQDGMEMMRCFWDAAAAVDQRAAALDEGGRFPLCRPEPLRALFEAVGLRAVAVRPIDIPTVFPDFDAYWTPFLGGQGAAPAYLASLDPQTREQVRAGLRARLGTADGSIALTARAWAAQGTV